MRMVFPGRSKRPWMQANRQSGFMFVETLKGQAIESWDKVERERIIPHYTDTTTATPFDVAAGLEFMEPAPVVKAAAIRSFLLSYPKAGLLPASLALTASISP